MGSKRLIHSHPSFEAAKRACLCAHGNVASWVASRKLEASEKLDGEADQEFGS